MNRHHCADGRRRAVVFHLFVLSCAVPGIASAQSVMQPGAWQMEMTATAHHPQTRELVTLGSSKTAVCLTPEFLAKEPYLTAGVDEQKMRQRGATCSTSDFARDGNTASWKMGCTMGNGQSFELTIKNTAAARTLKSEMHQVGGPGAEETPVDIRVVGTFVGECTQSMPRL